MGNKRSLFPRMALTIALAVTMRAALWPQSMSAQSGGSAGASSGPAQSYSQPPPDWQKAAGGEMAFDTVSIRQNTTTPARGWNSNFTLGPGDVHFPHRRS